jgi:hypothetical protein
MSGVLSAALGVLDVLAARADKFISAAVRALALAVWCKSDRRLCFPLQKGWVWTNGDGVSRRLVTGRERDGLRVSCVRQWVTSTAEHHRRQARNAKRPSSAAAARALDQRTLALLSH